MEKLDEKPCRDLQEQLKTGSAMFLSGDHPANVMTGVLRSLSALVTSRYHAAVLSMEEGCPIVAVSMDERLDSMMKELTLDEDYLLHVNDKYLGRDLFRALIHADMQQWKISRNIRIHTVEYKRELTRMGVFLKDYLDLNLNA